jgi:glycosyltransferase involved in cell wall biosynthesis
LTISVIVPTYNGAHRILNVLRALEDQKVNDFELIVAIDGSNDDTLTVLNNSNFSFKNFRIIEQPNKGRASIRNLGAKNADGDLLIFYDDDMRPASDSVAKHLDFHRKYENCLCGGIQLEQEQMCRTDIQKYKRHLSFKWTAKYKQGLNKLNRKTFSSLQQIFLFQRRFLTDWEVLMNGLLMERILNWA